MCLFTKLMAWIPRKFLEKITMWNFIKPRNCEDVGEIWKYKRNVSYPPLLPRVTPIKWLPPPMKSETCDPPPSLKDNFGIMDPPPPPPPKHREVGRGDESKNFPSFMETKPLLSNSILIQSCSTNEIQLD